MRRIYLVAAIRYAIHPVTLKSLIAIVFFWRSTAYVSYKDVIANAPSLYDLKRDIGFFTSALENAEGVALALVLSVALLAIWITYDMLAKRTHAWI